MGFPSTDRPLGWLKRAVPGALVLTALYYKGHGRIPNLLKPATFTEKVLWRVIFDRRPLLAQISDKAQARGYIAQKLHSRALPELYHVTNTPATIPFDSLPKRFVVRPTHGSGWVELVFDKERLDRSALVDRCRGWLSQNYASLSHEWIYKDVEPRILVEELVSDGGAGPPKDFKLLVFHGRVYLVQVDVNRFGDHERGFYTPEWSMTDVRLICQGLRAPVARPPHLEAMIEAAELLGQDFDFVRVDCFCTAEKFFVNELSATPCRGLNPFHPRAFDRTLGAQWRLPVWGPVRRSGGPSTAPPAPITRA